MAYEDFTTYTKTDPSDKLTVTASRVTATNIKGSDGWTEIYKNFGANHWSGDFTHLYTVCMTDLPSDGGLYLYRIHNGTYTVDNLLEVGGGTKRYDIVEQYTSTYYDYYGLTESTVYYSKFHRADSVGTYGTIYTYIYSDSARTDLLDTLSLALHAKLDYSTMVPILMSGDVYGERSGYIENLDLQESPGPTPVVASGRRSLVTRSRIKRAAFHQRF